MIDPSEAVPSPSGPSDAGEAAAEATEDHAAAEGADASSSSGMGSTDTLREMLMSTDPAPKLANVDSPWDPDLGGPARIYRALLKMGSFDGMPAVGDLIIGIAETVQGLSLDEPGDQEASDDGGEPTAEFGEETV